MRNSLNSALRAYNRVGVPIAGRPVTVSEVLDHLKMDPAFSADVSVSTEINAFIDAAVTFGENQTKLTFRESNFIAYWDGLHSSNYPYEIRKFPLNSITSIAYYDGGEQKSFDVSHVQIKSCDGFSRIQPAYGYCWPSSNYYDGLNNASINFVAGYGEGELPESLKVAVLYHVAAMWGNRGDCTASGSSACSLVPCVTSTVYQQHAILDMWVGA